MDPNPFRKLSEASTTGEPMDVRANPGTPEDSEQVEAGMCPRCHTCADCQSRLRDVLLQNPSTEPDQDVWFLKNGQWEKFVYSNVVPRPSPGPKTQEATTPQSLHLVRNTSVSGIGIDQNQCNSGPEQGMNSAPSFVPQWNTIPASLSMQLTASSQVFNQAAGASPSQSIPTARDSGEASLSLGAMKYYFPGDLPGYKSPLMEGGSINAQGSVEHMQSSDNFNNNWSTNGSDNYLLPLGYGYEGNHESRNMIHDSKSPPSDLTHFDHWKLNGETPANASVEAMESSMNDDNDDSQYSITSGTPSNDSTPPRFTCGACYRSYKRNYDLHRHEKNHLGVRPYKCPFPQCQSRVKGFVRSDHLNQHVKKKHPDASFEE